MKNGQKTIEAIQILSPDYSDPETPRLRINIPSTEKVRSYTHKYYCPNDLKDPMLQEFTPITVLTGNNRRKFATHILQNGNTWFHAVRFPIKMPGSPIFLPRQLSGSYLPILQSAVADYSQMFPIDHAVISLNVKMGSLSPALPGQEYKLYIDDHHRSFHDIKPSSMTGTFWHMDGGGRGRLKRGAVNKSEYWYICANRLQTAFVKARGFDIEDFIKQKGDLAEKMARTLAPEDIAYSRPYTVYRFSPLALHSGEEVTPQVLEREGKTRKGKIFRHFATLNIFIPDTEHLDHVSIHLSENGPLKHWMTTHNVNM
jgi:hypothetical protein